MFRSKNVFFLESFNDVEHSSWTFYSKLEKCKKKKKNIKKSGGPCARLGFQVWTPPVAYRMVVAPDGRFNDHPVRKTTIQCARKRPSSVTTIRYAIQTFVASS